MCLLLRLQKLRKISFSKPNILSKLVVLGEADGYIAFETLMTYGKVVQPCDVNPRTSTAVLLSSSGTTGLPKFVRLSHVNIAVNMIQLQ